MKVYPSVSFRRLLGKTARDELTIVRYILIKFHPTREFLGLVAGARPDGESVAQPGNARLGHSHCIESFIESFSFSHFSLEQRKLTFA